MCRTRRSLQKVCARVPRFGKPAASEKGLTSLVFSVAGLRLAAPLRSLDSTWALQPRKFPIWLQQTKAWLRSGAAGWLIKQLFPTGLISPLHWQHLSYQEPAAWRSGKHPLAQTVPPSRALWAQPPPTWGRSHSAGPQAGGKGPLSSALPTLLLPYVATKLF